MSEIGVKGSHERLIPIDILKIVFAGLIFMRHARTMGGISWYGLNNFVLNSTSMVMTGFFLLSGFALYYQYGDKNISQGKSLCLYYKKRFISIMPAYLLIHFVYLLLYQYDVEAAIRLFPIELVGIQAWFNTLFGTLHNGGTWFVSCLLLCYFIYPLLQELLNSCPKTVRITILALLVSLSVYSVLVCVWFGCADNYSNPLFRFLEFASGAALCSIRGDEKTENDVFPIIFSLMSAILLAVAVYQKLWFLYLPGLCSLVISASRIRVLNKRKMFVIKYLSTLSYLFFLLQCVLWNQFVFLLAKMPYLQTNRLRLILALVILLSETIFFHELYEKPIQKLLKRKMLS